MTSPNRLPQGAGGDAQAIVDGLVDGFVGEAVDGLCGRARGRGRGRVVWTGSWAPASALLPRAEMLRRPEPADTKAPPPRAAPRRPRTLPARKARQGSQVRISASELEYLTPGPGYPTPGSGCGAARRGRAVHHLGEDGLESRWSARARPDGRARPRTGIRTVGPAHQRAHPVIHRSCVFRRSRVSFPPVLSCLMTSGSARCCDTSRAILGHGA